MKASTAAGWSGRFSSATDPVSPSPPTSSGEVEAHLFATGSLEIVIPVNQTAEGRFWQNLARFAGTVDSSGRGRGLWTCAPFDIDTGGYVDQSVVVEGGFQMEPQE
jgi:hypothetical protein